MTIHNLYIFDRHCECIYFQKWSHQRPSSMASVNATSTTTSSKTGGLLTSTSRYSTSSATSNVVDSNPANSSAASSYKAGDDNNRISSMQSAATPGNNMSLEEEAKLVYGVVLSLRNFVRKLSGKQDGFISYKTSAYKLHYYETPTGLKFIINSDQYTESLRPVLRQIYVQLYVEFVVKNALMRFDNTRWTIGSSTVHDIPIAGDDDAEAAERQETQQIPAGYISNELFRVAVDRFIRSLSVF
ncbi:Sybindin-like family-domain-containing protein, partial [Umbelopsis sp. AD052]